MTRRNFTQKQKEQIVERSKRDGKICCERCGLVLDGKPHEVDHIIAEALRPEADKQKPITIAEGQLLGKACCHRGVDGKTNQDIKAIAHAKRVYNRANGLKQSAGKLRGAPFPKSEKAARRMPKQPLPPRQLFEERKS